jgi:hypothetical protein
VNFVARGMIKLLGGVNGYNGLGTVPLRSFLLLACGLGDGVAAGPDAVEIDGLDLHSAQVNLEVAVRVPGGTSTRRVDLLVSLPHGEGSRALLVVEYKVDAAETDDQTVDYAAWARAEAATQGWPSEPLLVYLCPGQGQPVSDRFVVVDYDAYVPWLDELRERRPSPTAAFLLAEFRACLGLRADVQDERQAELQRRVVESDGDAIEALRRCPPSLPELQAAVARHKDALNALGLFVSRQSKGYSAFVAAFREALLQRLDPATWAVGGGEGSLVAIYLPTAAALREVSGKERGLTSAIRVHVIMERPRRERARAVLEVIGNHPDLDAVDSRKLREHLASDLRARLGDHFDQATRGMIVGAFVLPAPGIDGLADDVEARVTGLAGEFAATAERVRQLGDALTGWTAVFRGAVEDPHTVV